VRRLRSEEGHPKAIKAFLQKRAGLEYVLLGGDTTVVPARKSWDTYSNAIAGKTFTEDIATDFYYSDLSEWDTNGDGVYAHPKTDKPSYAAQLAVGRLPIAKPEQGSAHVERVIKHMTRFDISKVGDTLLLSNVATEVGGVDAMILPAGSAPPSSESVVAPEASSFVPIDLFVATLKSERRESSVEVGALRSARRITSTSIPAVAVNV
jgi:hypothetical protein